MVHDWCTVVNHNLCADAPLRSSYNSRVHSDPKEIGAAIKRLRLERSLTQERLAERLDISLSMMKQIESGGKVKGWSRIVNVARALGVTPNAFFGAEEGITAAKLGEALEPLLAEANLDPASAERFARIALQAIAETEAEASTPAAPGQYRFASRLLARQLP